MDYLEGRLKRNVREHVEEHLCTCSDCRDLLMMTSELIHGEGPISEEPAPPAVTQRTIEAVNSVCQGRSRWKSLLAEQSRRLFSKGRTLVEDVFPGPAPQPAVLRSGRTDAGDETIREHFTGEGFEAVIAIEKTTDTYITIQVEIIPDPPLKTPMRVALFAGAQEIASATLFEEPVEFEEIPYGDYTLVFSQEDRRTTVYSLEV